MNYGESIDPDYKPGNDQLYAAFVEYFGDPDMTKIKNINGHGMYVAKSDCMLATHSRYLIAFVNSDTESISKTLPLSYLPWKVLQMRTLTDMYNVETFSHQSSSSKLREIIQVKSRTDKSCVYTCEGYPISVSLICEDWEKGQDNANKYHSRGRLYNAVETWKTIIVIE